ncbi:transposase [Serpentinicella sp. ANB-PHB4]|uniref:transposase n=1 Tax=Serpentinicella sp. ANB-PHB4 TaxID=3074076 RepID=UPI0028587BE0|nr:transposase [Serpentinicella sp. ANB-PHB4]MDR5658544.1 transposase [Serpentinicella sp. ANB-PHB4]
MKKYTDEFKLQVIKDYYQSDIGVRAIARRYELPSKNYINNWEKQLKKKGLLPEDASKLHKTAGPSKNSHIPHASKTTREKQLEAENIRLKAQIEYLESIKYMKPFLSKKKLK